MLAPDELSLFVSRLEASGVNYMVTGATAAIQPGGSVKDAEVIAAADERNMAMVFTGARHFRH